ncbi:hypothetical protein AZ044_003397, partial [Pluralibacter gergoviae]
MKYLNAIIVWISHHLYYPEKII